MALGRLEPILGGAGWPQRLVLWASAAALLFLLIWYQLDFFLLAFAGALVAIVLHGCADWVNQHTPRTIGPKLSYTAIVLAIVALACLIAYLIIPSAVSEITQIARTIPQSLGQITAYLDQKDWGRYLLGAAHHLLGGSSLDQKSNIITSDIEEAIEGAVVILVVGLYGALYARGYTQGLLELVPAIYRPRVAKVAQAMAYTLRWWMIGQLVPMVVLGIATTVGLWILKVPLALALGLLTGLMVFIPYVGAWIAFVPTVLVSLSKDPHTALYVAMLYLALHLLEGYALSPLVQKRAVLLPPVMTILSQFFMWKVAGLLGVALATPLAAALLVLVKTAYLHEEVAAS